MTFPCLGGDGQRRRASVGEQKDDLVTVRGELLDPTGDLGQLLPHHRSGLVLEQISAVAGNVADLILLGACSSEGAAEGAGARPQV